MLSTKKLNNHLKKIVVLILNTSGGILKIRISDESDFLRLFLKTLLDCQRGQFCPIEV